MTSLAWRSYEILTNFIEIGGCLFFAWCWVKNEYTNRFISISSIAIILLGATWQSLYLFIDIPFVPDIIPAITCVFVYLFLVLKIKWDIAITAALLNIIILGIMTYAVDGFFSAFLNVPYGFLMTQDIPRIVTMVLAHVMWAIVWASVIRWFRPSTTSNFITKGRWLIAIIPMFTIILITVLLAYARAVPEVTNNVSPLLGAGIGCGLILINLGAIYLYEQMTTQAQEAVLWQAQKQVGDMALQYKIELENLNQDMRRFRHDFQNHIYTLQGFANLDNYSALKNYLTVIGGEIQHLSESTNTGNQVLDALLNGYMNMSKQEDVRVMIEGSVPKTLPVSDQHLCVLIGNLFSNAYEACRKITNSDERYIRIQIYTQRNHLFISMDNSTNGEEKKQGNKWISTKSDLNDHGFGLLSIDVMIKQYHGYCDRKHQNKIFSTTIVIPLIDLS